MHAASALRSLRVCSANARNVRAVGLVTWSMLSASSARATGPVPATPRTMLIAEAAEHEAAHALGMRKRKERRDARAHRIADDVRALDLQMVQQPARIFRHQRRAVGLEACGFALSPWPRLS